jgi:hypothetical protein
MKKTNYLLILFIILLSSCSTFKITDESLEEEPDLKMTGYERYDQDDYEEHFKEFEKFYLESSLVESISIKYRSKKYLERIANSIIKNNELFFTEDSQPKFIIIKNPTPFHFSLPGRRIFISSGLVKKYIKSEKLLYCLVTYELIRSEKNIYRKAMIIPTGTMNTTRMLSIMRLSTFEKVEIHKWAFYILKRLGIDTDNYLSWIQIQNRNSIDFSLQLGDINSISREESLFKAFLIKNTKETTSAKKYTGSSRDFYSFVNSIK